MKTRTLTNSILATAGILPILMAPAMAHGHDRSQSAPAQPKLRYRIAVNQVKWNDIHGEYNTLPPDVRDGVQAQLVDKLTKSGYFIVMDRETTDQENHEDQVDAAKRATLPSGATMMPARQTRTAAAYIITPSVVGVTVTSDNQSGINFGILSLHHGKSKATVTLNVRISDAQTSEVLDTETTEGSVDTSSNGIAVNLVNGNSASNDQTHSGPAGRAVDRALDNAVDKIIERLSQEPWKALVAMQDKSSNRVIINAGDLTGVEVGEEFDVYRNSEAIYDPSTGEKISDGEQTRVGRIKISKVERNASFCDVEDGTGFQPQDVVKLPG